MYIFTKCTYINVHTYIYIRITYIYIRICRYVDMCLHEYMFTYIHIQYAMPHSSNLPHEIYHASNTSRDINVFIYIYIYIYIYIFMNMYICFIVYISMYIYLYICLMRSITHQIRLET